MEKYDLLILIYKYRKPRKLYLFMKLVERHIINKSDKRWKSLDDICFLSKNLYNSALYYIKNKKMSFVFTDDSYGVFAAI